MNVVSFNTCGFKESSDIILNMEWDILFMFEHWTNVSDIKLLQNIHIDKDEYWCNLKYSIYRNKW